MKPTIGRIQWGAVWLGVGSLALLPLSPLAAQEPKLRDTLKGHTSWVRSIAFSPDGKTLASASSDSTIKLWDVATGKEQATLEGHTNVVHSVAYSPDGKTLASGQTANGPPPPDKTIKLWDIPAVKKADK